MLIGRITKDSAAVRRVIVDFVTNGWLDALETIASKTAPTVVVEQLAVWQNGVLATVPFPPPSDTTPLVVNSSVLISTNQKVQLMLGAGTPGLTYKVTFTVTGTSGRTEQVDILVFLRQPV